MEQAKTQISRRTVAKGAAWSVPVVTIAMAAPALAASPPGPGPAPNDEANYYWSGVPGPDKDTVYTSLVPAVGGRMAQFSTQISYQSTPYVNPPSGPILIVMVTFSQPVTISALSSGWTAVPGRGPATSFTFTKSDSTRQGGSLSFNATADHAGELTATALMETRNNQRPDGSYATWSSAVGEASTTVSD